MAKQSWKELDEERRRSRRPNFALWLFLIVFAVFWGAHVWQAKLAIDYHRQRANPQHGYVKEPAEEAGDPGENLSENELRGRRKEPGTKKK